MGQAECVHLVNAQEPHSSGKLFSLFNIETVKFSRIRICRDLPMTGAVPLVDIFKKLSLAFGILTISIISN